MDQRANEGVDARLIISTGVEDYNGVELWINRSTAISAATLTSPYVHNKGIVSDDVAVVSSVNWTPNSFFNNRECAVAIYSSEIADFFADAFRADFERCYDYGGVSVDISEIESHYPAGEEVTFTVTVEPAGNYTYVWDFGDGSEPLTTTQSRVPHVPDLGGKAGDTFTLKVTVLEDNVLLGERTKTYSVGDVDVPADPGSDGEGSEIMSLLSEYMYILAPIIVILLAIVGAVSRKGKKKRK